MSLHFSKYHGAQNDFIVIDNQSGQLSENEFKKMINLCQRRSGIGADGVLLLENAQEDYKYRMRYYNPDGKEVQFCGNGARCLYQFALDENIIETDAVFIAGDGEHYAGRSTSGIKIRMTKVTEIKIVPDPKIGLNSDFGLYNTGVDHLVLPVQNIDEIDINKYGLLYRPDGVLLPNGVNVNVFEVRENKIRVRTFERGVEGETMACGTGVVAVAYHLIKRRIIDKKIVSLYSPGGELLVEFPGGIEEYPWLHGEAVKVYSGVVN